MNSILKLSDPSNFFERTFIIKKYTDYVCFDEEKQSNRQIKDVSARIEIRNDLNNDNILCV